MFDVGPAELLVVALVALFVFGPERLPSMARQAGAWVRDLRQVVADARRDLTEHAGLDPADVQALRDLDPRSAVRRHVLDGLDDQPPPPGPRPRPGGPSGPAGGPPPVDPDTT